MFVEQTYPKLLGCSVPAQALFCTVRSFISKPARFPGTTHGLVAFDQVPKGDGTLPHERMRDRQKVPSSNMADLIRVGSADFSRGQPAGRIETLCGGLQAFAPGKRVQPVLRDAGNTVNRTGQLARDRSRRVGILPQVRR